MKKGETNKKVRWDPIAARLAEGRMKQTVCVPITNTPKQQAIPTKETAKTKVTGERRSNEEFSEYLKSLFADDNLPFKYQNPDAWILYKSKKRKKTWYF